LGGLMLMVGLAFKLSAVPFHFWCPDVFEGASAKVDAFLSVASKAAALALLVRVAFGFGALPPVQPEHVAGVYSVADPGAASAVHAPDPSAAANPNAHGLTAAMKTATLESVRDFMAKLLIFLSAITCTFGNLAAYGQTNIKRLLAYSTIAHAGYMMMPIAAALTLTGSDPAAAQTALT